MANSLKQILSRIKEGWVDTVRGRGKSEYNDVFENPSRKEIKELKSQSERDVVRFIADSRKEKVYVVSLENFHVDIIEVVDSLTRDSIFHTFWGLGNISLGEIEISSFSDEYDGSILDRYLELCNNIIDGKYDWMEKYRFDLYEIKSIAKEEIDRYN